MKDITPMLDWASKSRMEDGIVGKFLVSSFDKQILVRLNMLQGQSMLVKGKQGIGKSRRMRYYTKELGGSYPDVLAFKWQAREPIDHIYDTIKKVEELRKVRGQAFLDVMAEDDTSAASKFRWQALLDANSRVAKSGLQDPHRVAAFEKQSDKTMTREEFDKGVAEMRDAWRKAVEKERRGPMLTDLKRTCRKEAKRRFVLHALATCKNVLIDFPDIMERKSVPVVMDGIRDIWEVVHREADVIPNFVIFWQLEMEEAASKHFFFREGGKLNHFRLDPFSDNDLTEYYCGMFNSPRPFTKDALDEIAIISRGIFRLFKTYIAECLWAVLDNPDLGDVTLERLAQLIGMDTQLRIRDVELSSIHKGSLENRRRHVLIEHYLRENDSTALQSELMNEFFDGRQDVCSRFMSAMEIHGYIRRDFDGHNKRVFLVG